MKDRNGTEIEKGDLVHCNGLEFTIDYFQDLGDGNDLACGEYGCINTDLLELVEKGDEK